MYNYEATPPEGVWKAIAAELDGNEAKVIPMNPKKNKRFYYMAAASVLIILLGIIFFTNRYSKKEYEQQATSSQKDSGSNNNNDHLIMTVPTEEKATAKNTVENNELVAQNKTQKGGPNQKPDKDAINNNDSAYNNLIASNASRYITIEGPQGQPVKVSSKMASLIDSSETKTASKPIWNKKINEWKEIMKGNTLAPTPGNFLDIVELTKSLKDNR